MSLLKRKLLEESGDCIIDNSFVNTTNKLNALYHINRKMFFSIKRFFDILFSILGISVLIPITAIIKICYLFTGDTHSVFYIQKRIGKNGKVISIYKLRSMVYNADEVLNKLLTKKKYKKEWELYQKFENDPRITKIGKFLRKTSLDELPQFINILKGEMSLIGPRPLVEGELDTHNGNHKLYESIKPGLTGWWACNGRSNVTYSERLNLEYYYCLNASILLDIKIIFKTIKVVLFGKGAE